MQSHFGVSLGKKKKRSPAFFLSIKSSQDYGDMRTDRFSFKESRNKKETN